MEPQLFNLNSSISKEIVESEVVESSFILIVSPQQFERKHLSVIGDVLLKTLIRMTSSKLDLNILLVLLSIWRVDFGILDPGEMIEGISWRILRFTQWTFHVLVELSGEIVAIVDSEDSLVEVDVFTQSEILPSVVIRKLTNDLGNFLPFQEDALRNT